MSNKIIFRKFDLPVELHEKDGADRKYHDKTPKAKTPAEIESRKGLAPGTIGLERLQRGTVAAGALLSECVRVVPNNEFAVRTIAAAAFNTSWYSLAQGSDDVMRRQLDLPVLLDVAGGQITPRAKLIMRASYLLSTAHKPVRVLRMNNRLSESNRRRAHASFGRMVGNASMLLSAASAKIGPEDVDSPGRVAESVRRSALQTWQDATSLHAEIGKHPSLAALATPDSDLNVYWRRCEPHELRETSKRVLGYHYMPD